ncbi:uncharacterized protein FIBRA_00448 [Fibroporia radiculosa]|uniref:DUF7962 domain-containing protein n=1 Tax=Fibroporia radiculosa TaxID=599839 RepID=J4GHS8_9APHY|nr:uncharacterized protein FIBRA_00448 [Fibroporia radiculosa]CCL98450.1 predicted protein [Fibroporia radiculosa]
MLTLKKVPHSRVDVGSLCPPGFPTVPDYSLQVSFVSPRPELSQYLGVTYRRIPVLAIGNDIYCDTNLIAAVLERRFPPSAGYGTLFPHRSASKRTDATAIKIFTAHYIERAVFSAAADHLPWERLPPELIRDRSALVGSILDVPTILSRREESKSALSSHLSNLENQLADGRDWLMDTVGPSLADIAAHFVFVWVRGMQTLGDILDAAVFPRTMLWFARMSAALDDLQKAKAAPFTRVPPEEAAKLIASFHPEDLSAVGFDAVEAMRLGVKLGDNVAVAPTDTGKVPTTGTLVALSREEVVIETQGSHAIVHCHFPRLNYSVKLAQGDTKL